MKFGILFLFFSTTLLAANSESEAIRRTVRSHLSEVKNCYASAMKKNPGLKGKMVLDWDVNDKGAVTKAALNEKKSTLNNEDVTKCITEKLMGWKFPAAEVGKTISVSYPFDFSNWALKK